MALKQPQWDTESGYANHDISPELQKQKMSELDMYFNTQLPEKLQARDPINQVTLSPGIKDSHRQNLKKQLDLYTPDSHTRYNTAMANFIKTYHPGEDVTVLGPDAVKAKFDSIDEYSVEKSRFFLEMNKKTAASQFVDSFSGAEYPNGETITTTGFRYGADDIIKEYHQKLLEAKQFDIQLDFDDEMPEVTGNTVFAGDNFTYRLNSEYGYPKVKLTTRSVMAKVIDDPQKALGNTINQVTNSDMGDYITGFNVGEFAKNTALDFIKGSGNALSSGLTAAKEAATSSDPNMFMPVGSNPMTYEFTPTKQEEQQLSSKSPGSVVSGMYGAVDAVVDFVPNTIDGLLQLAADSINRGQVQGKKIPELDRPVYKALLDMPYDPSGLAGHATIREVRDKRAQELGYKNAEVMGINDPVYKATNLISTLALTVTGANRVVNKTATIKNPVSRAVANSASGVVQSAPFGGDTPEDRIFNAGIGATLEVMLGKYKDPNRAARETVNTVVEKVPALREYPDKLDNLVNQITDTFVDTIPKSRVQPLKPVKLDKLAQDYADGARPTLPEQKIEFVKENMPGSTADEVSQILSRDTIESRDNWITEFVNERETNPVTDLGVKTRTAPLGMVNVTKKGLDTFNQNWGNKLNIRTQLIEKANKVQNDAYSSLLKEHPGVFRGVDDIDKFVSSSEFRLMDEGVTKIDQPEILDAYLSVKRKLAENNAALNIPLVKKVLGRDVTLDVNHTSTAASGMNKYFVELTPDDIELTVRNGNDPAKLEKSVYRDIDKNGQVNRVIAILDYADSPTAIYDGIETQSTYFRKQYPFLFDEAGNLNKARIKFAPNAHRYLADFPEGNTLTSDVFGKVKGVLENAQISPDEAEIILGTLAKNTNFSQGGGPVFYQKFVGSLAEQADKGKIGVVTLNPFHSQRSQAIQLTKKFYRDPLVEQLAKARYEVSKKLHNMGVHQSEIEKAGGIKGELSGLEPHKGLNTELIDDPVFKWERASLFEKLHALKYNMDMITDKPGFLTEQVQGLIGRENYQKTLTSVDKALHLQSTLKLAGSVSGGVANFIQATNFLARYSLDNTFWDGVRYDLKNIHNGNFENTFKNMIEDPYYGKLYANLNPDRQVDSAFQRTQWANTGGKVANAIREGALTFVKGGILGGKVVVYRAAENMANVKGLTGREKSDFIFDIMTESMQVHDMTKVGLVQQDKLLKTATFLQDFLFGLTYSMGKHLGDIPDAIHTAKYVDKTKGINKLKKAVKTGIALNTAPVLVAGYKGNPITATGGWMLDYEEEKRTGSKFSDQLAQSSKKGNALATVVRYGLPGLFGVDPSSLAIDPNQVTSTASIQGSVLAQALYDIIGIAGNVEVGIEQNTPLLGLWDGLLDVTKSQIPLAGRAKKATDILTAGRVVNKKEQTTVEYTKEQRLPAALSALAGVRTTSEDQMHAEDRTIKGVREKYTTQVSSVYEDILRAQRSGNKELEEELRDVLRTSYNKSNQDINQDLKRKKQDAKKTKVERTRQQTGLNNRTNAFRKYLDGKK